MRLLMEDRLLEVEARVFYEILVEYLSKTDKIQKANYYWKKDAKDNYTDKPYDKDDHAMDTLKYMLTYRPDISKVIMSNNKSNSIPTQWREIEELDND